MKAIKPYLERTAIPVLAEKNGEPFPHGTATLYTENNRYFLITAAHVVEGLEDQICVPLSANGKIVTIGRHLGITPKERPGLDAAVLELKENELINDLKSFWKFIGPENYSLPRQENDAILYGYPIAAAECSGGNIIQSDLMITTFPLESRPPASDPEPTDIFFKLRTATKRYNGEEVTIPRLNGMSGSAVWQWSKTVEGLWLPDRALKIVGIQQSALHGKWARATGWTIVRMMLDELLYS